MPAPERLRLEPAGAGALLRARARHRLRVQALRPAGARRDRHRVRGRDGEHRADGEARAQGARASSRSACTHRPRSGGRGARGEPAGDRHRVHARCMRMRRRLTVARRPRACDGRLRGLRRRAARRPTWPSTHVRGREPGGHHHQLRLGARRHRALPSAAATCRWRSFPAEPQLDEAYAEVEEAAYLDEEAGPAGHRARARWSGSSATPARAAWCDLGCWVGFLVSEAERRGWRASGVEPSRFASDYARDAAGARRGDRHARVGRPARPASSTRW